MQQKRMLDAADKSPKTEGTAAGGGGSGAT